MLYKHMLIFPYDTAQYPIHFIIHLVDTTHFVNVGFMLAQRRKQWANIKITLAHRLVFLRYVSIKTAFSRRLVLALPQHVIDHFSSSIRCFFRNNHDNRITINPFSAGGAYKHIPTAFNNTKY